MIIFGWGRRITWNIGPTHKMKCSHCHNEDYFYLKVVTTWFTLFFIPIFPYERYHFLYCPTCEYGVKLDSDQVSILKPTARLNQQLVDGTITKEEYLKSLQDLSSEKEELAEEREIIREGELIEDVKETKQCKHCGGEIKTIAKKCKHCKKWI